MVVIPVKGVVYEMIYHVHGQGPLNNNRRSPCMDLELNYAECLEAYGANRGLMICRKFFEDVSECRTNALRKIRHRLMLEERAKKVAKGEIPHGERWGQEYPYDSFVAGTFTP